MIELRLPNIKGSDKEQLVQIRSYLYQLTEQLQWALNNTSASVPSNVTPPITPRTTISSSNYTRSSGETWTNLGLSADVTESESNVGRASESGCYYRVCAGEKHIYVAFNCAFTFSGSTIIINAEPIPEDLRPKRDVYAICVTDEGGVARILVTKEGNILVDWVQTISSAEATVSSTVKWIDGYIDYWT